MKTIKQRLVAIACCIAFAASAAAFAQRHTASDAAPHWVAAWASALHAIPAPSYGAVDVAGRTVREIVYPTLSGRTVRIRVSNAYSDTPLVVNALRIAPSTGSSAALAAPHSAVVTFGGRRAIELPPGQDAQSDPIEFDIDAGKPYALSLYVGERQTMRAWHGTAMQVNYVSEPGDHTSDANARAYPTSITNSAWVTELAVAAPPSRRAAAIAAVGDSLTDGLHSSANLNRRWPDEFARRLAQAGERELGVVNLGISGNRLLTDSRCLGVALEKRFARDVLARAGVKVAILMIGVNDINFIAAPVPLSGVDCFAPRIKPDAQALIDGYQRMIAAAHEHGIAIFGGTLTPTSMPPEREAVRQKVNAWIRSSGAFDGIVDFDAAVRDPANPSALLPNYNSGDDIHPNDAGYAAMAKAVPIDPITARAEAR
ncbi:lipase [Burkholderia singularis]|uniref:Lipase n=1 Tax=Burkholderia singularis TaxID=1503053 RepID=A0A124P9R6_9BURK|nr:SGNH/GDSL hydrolase family protein [Burkholderia singularis]KVE29332.1 lipase [Burkholderia singularis]